MTAYNKMISAENKSGGETTGNLLWLSSLRGIAALLVFISHLPIHMDRICFIVGRSGVCIFFLMSGYLAYGSRMKRTTRQYLFNRFIRMYPVYWILLIFIFMLEGKYSGIELAANFTLFQEFLGVDCFIGASWMMPIQIVFFLIVAFCANNLFERKEFIFGISFDTISFGLFCISSIGISYLRYHTNIPFPTAFVLLILVGYIGIDFRYNDSTYALKHLTLFEITLVISVCLSYSDMAGDYFFAYNLAIVIFFLFMKYGWNFYYMTLLSKIGFSFFLGSDIAYDFVLMLPGSSGYSLIMVCLLKFLFSICIAWAMTTFIEKPLNQWEKRAELYTIFG